MTTVVFPVVAKAALRLASASPAIAYAPVETFGTIYRQADNWHTDARGYDPIAGALVPLVLDGSAKRWAERAAGK